MIARTHIILGGTFLIAALIPLIAGPYVVTFILYLAVALILAQSWDWIGGQMGYINLGHFCFYGIGAYAFGITVVDGGTVSGGFALAALIAMGIAFLVSFPLFRLHGDYFAFATLALLPLCQILAFNLDGLTQGSTGIPLPPRYVLVPAYYAALGIAAATVVISIALNGSRFGYALRAIRNDEQAAAMVGINLLPTKVAVMTLTAGFAGLAGAVQTWQIGYLDPTTTFALEPGLVPVAMVLLGGSGLLLGPLLGVVALGTLHQLLLVKLTILQTTVYGLVLLLVGRFMPRGLLSVLSPPDRIREAAQVRAASPTSQLALPKTNVQPIRPILECRDVTMSFGGLKAVDRLSLQVTSGQIVGLVGPNGSGKTTLFNCVSKVYQPTGGEIFLNGESIATLGPHGVSRRGLGRTYQIPRPFSDLTVEENVAIPLLFRGNRIPPAQARREARDFAAFAGLSAILNSRADTLSLQEKKALEFARALACKPSLLLVDEVAAGLNPSEVRHFVELLRDIRNEFGTTIIWVEHIFWALAEVVDRLVVMENGAIIADGPLQKLIHDENVLRAYLGAPDVALAS